MYKYLVCRLDAIRPAGTMKNSSHFPMVVEMEFDASVQQVIERALDSINHGYRPDYDYIVVPLDDAKVVRLLPPKPRYDIHVRRYE